MPLATGSSDSVVGDVAVGPLAVVVEVSRDVRTSAPWCAAELGEFFQGVGHCAA